MATACVDASVESLDSTIPVTFSIESAKRDDLSPEARIAAPWRDAGAARDPIALDRRRLPRKVMKGGGMAVFTQGFCAGTVVRVELIDGSHTGLGIKCPIAIEPGTSFSLIPDHPMMPRAVGIAVRCDAVDGGFHVGLRTRAGAVAA